MYITISEFEELGGRSFDVVSEFDAVCRRAATYVDYYTQGRLKGEKSIPESVKAAMYEICSLILEGSADVESYSADGVSVTLKEGAGFDDKVYEIIRRNLPPALLYMGV